MKNQRNTIHKKQQQQNKNLTNQTLFLQLLLLRSGDIETNPGPMPNIL